MVPIFNDPSLTTILYGACALLLAGASLFLIARDGRSPQVRWFVAASLALLVWVVTLFLFDRSEEPGFVLLTGRVNFAAVSLAVYFGYRFVAAVASDRGFGAALGWLSAGIALAAVATPLIDQAEMVGLGTAGRHLTVYGPLFPLYVLHIVGMLAATLWTAYQGIHSRVADRHRKDQLFLIGGGILATGAVSLATNAALPFIFANFRFVDVGPLSTMLFLLAIAYAVVRHRLFDIRVFVRRTVVLGAALSLVLACYSALVLIATDRFTSAESGGLTRFGVLVLAFSFDPVRRFLEKSIDRLLFSPRDSHRDRAKPRKNSYPAPPLA